MIFKTETQIPQNYKAKLEFDFKTNKWLFLLLNVGSFVLVIPFIIAIAFFDLDISGNVIVAVLLIVIYFFVLIIHEVIHGIFFKLGTKEKVKFGFHGFAASASVPNVYFYKRHYLLVAVAPAIILNLILLICCFIFENEYFLMFYIILALHFAGCIGDFYVFFRLLKFKKDTLIEDTGIGMRFFVNTEVIK